MKYLVYRQQVGRDGEIVDILVATTFTEHDAKTLVKGLRAEQHNQLAYYTEEQKNEENIY